ncbi:hypothetical protein ANN_13625 [Periplaneta americana]|uniref:Carboxylesterase n=1 Tax=Periplaneta americana TaxID=6978 RepID=A0ABQ8TKD9_PERAM|nr:hypothetical protein ANN_13625 [Periplaneta americana]
MRDFLTLGVSALWHGAGTKNLKQHEYSNINYKASRSAKSGARASGQLRARMLFAVVLVIAAAVQADDIIVLKQGRLRGHRLTSRKGREIFAFQGIPYAKPPVGELRFRPPQLPEPWNGTLDATKDGSECIQGDFFNPEADIKGQEDCLYLNVYTPQEPGTGSSDLDVMFWIHGGGWLSGSGGIDQFGPQYLLDKNVVLVSINYRLGALGLSWISKHWRFLCPGNNGMKDQVAALRWVRDNIAKFGGNPNSVTVFGESAGGASAHYLMLSPASSDVARAVALYDDGRSVRYIANVMNMARSTTHDAIKRYRETLEYTRRPGSGRPRATNPNEDRYMVLRVLRERNLPATSVAQQFVNMHGRPISAKTVRRRLKASGLISSRPATGPRLLRMHRVERLRFANDHRDWRNGQWSCVLFTDESRFNLCSPDGRERVWRRTGERFSQCWISENVPYGGGGVMVWAGVCTDARTALVFVKNGRLIADRYINECLADHAVPFGQFLDDNFVLMHDNARPHIAHAVGDYLQEMLIHVLPWPARSPDMNPIEHVWDMLGRKKDAADIASTDKEFMEWEFDPMMPFNMVLETEVGEGDEAFLPFNTREAIRNASNQHPVPWMVGLTSGEGAIDVSRIFRNATLVQDFDHRFNEILSMAMFFRETAAPSDVNKIAQQIRKFYFGDRPVSNETAFAFRDMYTDGYILFGTDEAVKLHSQKDTPVYYYYFDYRGTNSYSTLFMDGNYGVAHQDELLYLFPQDHLFPNATRTAKDDQMVELLTTLWTNFAHTGNPTPKPDSGTWTPVSSPQALEFAHIDGDGLHMGRELLKERAEFWESLPLYASNSHSKHE